MEGHLPLPVDRLPDRASHRPALDNPTGCRNDLGGEPFVIRGMRAMRAQPVGTAFS
jgi:hypothetical protein